MGKKVLYILLLMFFILQSCEVLADNKQICPYNDSIENNIKTLYIPSGITTNAVLSQEVNSKTATIGQPISAILVQDFKYNNITIAPSGSLIEGSVVYNKKSSDINKLAKMEIRFTAIRTPYNNLIPINAVIKTKDSTGIINANSFKDIANISSDEKTTNVKNKDIIIYPNTKINLVFNQPITVSAQ